MELREIAELCHETNRAYCRLIGDNSQRPWEHAEDWQRMSAIRAVEFQLQHPNAAPDVLHKHYLNDKLADGWKYGPVKDPEKKEHPCCVPYDQLPLEERHKDALFVGIVAACSS